MFAHQSLEIRPLDIYILSRACDIPVVSLQRFENEFPLQFADCLFPQFLLESEKFPIVLRYRIRFRQSGARDCHGQMVRFDGCPVTGNDGPLDCAFELAHISRPIVFLQHFERCIPKYR